MSFSYLFMFPQTSKVQGAHSRKKITKKRKKKCIHLGTTISQQ